MRTVLVVDDEPAMLRTFERILTSAHFQVVATQDAAKAVALVTERSFDAVVSDVQMPKMSGVDLLRVIRAHDLDVPVLLVSGAPTIETAIEAVALGAFQYLLKPFDNAELVRAVERACQLHSLAKIKRDALTITGQVGTRPSDRAGLAASFERCLAHLWDRVPTHRQCRNAIGLCLRSASAKRRACASTSRRCARSGGTTRSTA